MCWRAWESWIEPCEFLTNFVCPFEVLIRWGSVHLDYDSTNPPGHLR